MIQAHCQNEYQIDLNEYQIDLVEACYRTLVRSHPEGLIILFDRELVILKLQGCLRNQTPFDLSQLERLDHLLPSSIHSLLLPTCQTACQGHPQTCHFTLNQMRYCAKAVPVQDKYDVCLAGILLVSEDLATTSRPIPLSGADDSKDLETNLIELERREAYFRALVQNSSDIISLIDVSGNIHYHSPAMRRILGYSGDDFLNQRWFNSIHPDDQARFSDKLKAAKDQPGIPVAIEYRVQQADQDWAWIESVLTNWLDNPDIEAIVMNSRDTSERKQVENALIYQIEFEALLTQLSTQFINLDPDQLDQGVIHALQSIQTFLKIDQAYIYLYDSNHTTLKMTHEWSQAGIPARLGSKGFEVEVEAYPWSNRQLDQLQPVVVNGVNSLPAAAAPERQAMLRRQLQSYILVPIAERGHLLGVLGLAAVNSQKNWSSEEISLLMTLGNIFASTFNQTRAELALRMSEERLQLVTEATSDAIWDWDLQTNATYWSEQLFKFLGLDAQCTQPDFDLFESYLHPEDRLAYELAFQNHLELGQPFDVEVRMQMENGSYRWFQSQGKVVRDASGEPIRMVGSLTNIHDRKRAEELLKQSLQEKVILLKEVHHRVKNNLQIISSLLRLQAGLSSDPSVISAFDDCQNRIQSIAMVHEQLYGNEQLERISLNDYINDLVRNVSHSLNLDYARIKIDINVVDVYVSLSQAIACGLILNELITNALKYAFKDRENGSLWITGRLIGQHVHLTVQDDGIGLPPSLDLSETDSLGLQLVDDMVAKLDGSLRVDSYQGQGTTFEIKFQPDFTTGWDSEMQEG